MPSGPATIARKTPNTARFAAIAIVNVATTVTANPGARRSRRTAILKSVHASFMSLSFRDLEPVEQIAPVP
jgi:hypothetical protein